jgi:hypothetical protein
MKLHAVLLAKLHGADQIDWSRAAVDSTFARAFGGVEESAPIPRIAAGRASSSTCWSMGTAFRLRRTLRRRTPRRSRHCYRWWID